RGLDDDVGARVPPALVVLLARRLASPGERGRPALEHGVEIPMITEVHHASPPKPRSARYSRSFRRASCTRQATVPSGQPRILDASSWARPSMHTRIKVVRSVSERESMP